MLDLTPAETADLVTRLTASLGDLAFETVVRELEPLSREKVVLVVGQVISGLAASTPKKAALAALRRRHDGKYATRLGIRAQGGRSAA
jgi:hypothetical protein